MAAATCSRYAAAAAASCPCAGTGRSTRSPTPRATAFCAFTGWSPKPGQTTTGTPAASASVKLFWPPCVRKRSTPAFSTSTCGRTGRQRAFAGARSGPSASGCGPSDTSRSGPSSGPSAPKASKTPPQAAWQSSRPVRPRRSPPAATARASQPKSGLSPVITVPMLARTTLRPASRASFSRARGSPRCPTPCCRCPCACACCLCSSPPSDWNLCLCPAALRAPCSSSNGPTATNLTPASSYACANSGGTGSCKSAHVVTRVRVLSAMPSILPMGLKLDRPISMSYCALALLMASCLGSKDSRISSMASAVSPSCANMASMAAGRLPGPAVVRRATRGMPSTLPARAASTFIKGQ
mmetsp:Transcript_1783/g.5635  ORF Transcript_1783/g.5635 Transcript_1783/m.5635 type:complete len:354 (+) Transcript_1783:506-1567(+)